VTLSVSLISATSGLMAAQTGLNAVSDDISNINTPGYVRTEVSQQQLAVNGQGQGVLVTGLKRVTDQYLEQASMSAGADASRFSTYSQYLGNAQSLFGDPSVSTSFFNNLNTIYTDFTAAANDPSNNLQRSQTISDLQTWLSQASNVNTQLTQLSSTVNTQVASDVTQANTLLGQIDQLNAAISRAQITGGDSSGAENMQSQLVDTLSSLMSVNVTARTGGGVNIRSPEGVLLAGTGAGAATLTYNATGSTPGYITAMTPGAPTAPQPISVGSGEIRGLLDLRNTALPGLSDQLGQFVSAAVQQINAAHNASSAVPAPSTLTGNNIGIDLPTAMSGFSGQTTIAITNSSGVVQHTVAIDFTAGTMSVDGGGPTLTSAPTFLADLNTAMSGFGSASFTNGQLSISASGGNGVAISEGTSSKAGEGFSAFFGLNDLVRPSGFQNYNTGLQPTDTSGFTAGGQVVFQLSSPDGTPIRNVTVAMPGAPANTIQDVLNALNNSATGVGLYGQFTLDQNGYLTFSGSQPSNANLTVASDNTSWGGTGPSFSQLFGVGVQARSARASSWAVDNNIVGNPQLLALSTLNLGVGAGLPALTPGDGTGAQAIANSGNVQTTFQPSWALGQLTTTVSTYSSEFAGAIGNAASAADNSKQSAQSVQTQAQTRLQSVEGVNMDEELVRMTTYQQAYSAAARMIQSSKDMFDTLLSMMN
jgi:flagellar hook-associated protein 1 FlgK